MYWIYFVAQWLTLAAVGVGFVCGIVVSPWFLLLLAPVGIVRLDVCRVRLRTLTCCGARPTSRRQLVQACQGDVCVVGQGWHFFLQRQTPDRPVVFTDNYVGTYTRKGVQYWRSGTTIAALARSYKNRLRKTFPSLPSYENISLGAWVCDINHGSSGDLGKPSNVAFGRVDYVDYDNRERQTPHSELVLSRVKCVLGVEIVVEKLLTNYNYEKRALFVTENLTLDQMQEWCRPCFQRVLFIGTQTVGVVWTRTRDDPPPWRCCRVAYHKEPHCCSRFCLWFQIDPCNVCCRCVEPAPNFHAVVDNYEMNRFVPYVWSVFALFACLHLNYEILVDTRDVKTDSAELLFALHEALREIPSGRFELRWSTHILFVDVSLRHSLHRPLEALHALGFQRYALHKGKYQYDYEAHAAKQLLFPRRTLRRISVEEMLHMPLPTLQY